ncbi:MAG TPA: 2-isopropylmalate synthase [Symbiobacteriaceae bacterium]|nr:2-isopropylmalate synthase [Symbiobacteriaceae bacterium]
MSKRIYLFDTTLRDGEQAPGFTMTPEGKLQIAQQLARLRVDVIEAGFPASSPGDFASVQQIAREVRGPVIAGLARCNMKDIETAARAVAPAERPRIHTFIATSPIHMEKKLRMTPDQVVDKVREMVAFAASFGMEVEFSAEDATRSDLRFLAQVFTVAAEAGATIMNVPDTVGYTTPKEMFNMFRYLINHVKGPREIIFSCHNHDDLGLASANTLAALEAGVQQVEGTINGIGERAGNVALEEVIMALKTRQDRFGCHTNANAREIHRTSRMLQSITGVSVQPNKAIVGANAFAHESGIHQDGMLKDRQTYEIMRPEDVGVPETSLVLGKHSGRAAFRDRLVKMGYDLSDADLERAFTRFKDLADRKKFVTDPDLEAIVTEEQQATDEVPVKLVGFQVLTGSGAQPSATVYVVAEDGTPKVESSSGDGPVNALYRAFDKAAGFEGHLVHYALKAVTDGQDALGEVVVKVKANGRMAMGIGASTDVLEASLRAYAAASNKLISGRGTVPVEGESTVAENAV